MEQSSKHDRDLRVRRWLRTVYGGVLFGAFDPPNPAAAVRMLRDDSGLLGDDPYLACAVGDVDALREATTRDPGFVHRPGGPLDLPPLVAVTHSSLLHVPAYRDRLHAAARWLLDAGADPNQRAVTPDGHRLSALYGAAGANHDLALTTMLLDAGADPNDGESLYHSLENPACARALVEHGARIAGSNAIYAAIDMPDPTVLQLLMELGGDPNEPARNAPITDWGSPLMWAIKRRRSRAHAEALLNAGADATKPAPDGTSPYSWAVQFGLDDVAALLRERIGPAATTETLTAEEQFVAACARGDADEARRIRADRPDLPAALSERQLRILPALAAAGHDAGVRTMAELGWPLETRGGDWEASALNMALYLGNEELTRFLLEHGASRTTKHGFGDDALGTLSWASRNMPRSLGDWAACARALREHGVPRGQRDPDHDGEIMIEGHSRPFPDDIAEVLLA